MSTEQSGVPRIRIPTPRIEITQDIINGSCQKNARHCMIAQAIKKRFPQAVNVVVDLATIRWSDRQKRLRYTFLTPPKGQEALVRFDMGTWIEPFSLSLRGGHATSMWDGRKKRGGSGSRTILSAKKSGPGQALVVEAVGGKPAPLLRNNLAKSKSRRHPIKHASHSTLRTFGVRGFTEGFVEVKK
jgi:hypothetical protein